ncbi:MAG: class I SAM-dependent methyltransferase [Sulfuritalea sp.]|nr:class I SAM-dependent methyltransferase [Sulfuritalea sp.]
MAYLEMAETESRHWWYCGRRAILAQMIGALDLPSNSKILEVGCGTGGNLEMLARFGEVHAIEMDGVARAIASRTTNNCCDIRAGNCPEQIPFTGRQFDLICMFDVLEHIERDTEALVAANKLLTNNGRILITVPAYQWLYGAHDEFLHHRRRYSLNQLKRKIAEAGLKAARISFFNTILFPLAVTMRLKDRLLGSKVATGTAVPPAIINAVLRTVFGAERFLLKHFNLPFGVSLLCLVNAADEH